MHQAPFKKRVAAILHADVADYSRLTSEHEEETHRVLSRSLDAVSQLVSDHGGEVMNYAGDAVLAVFPAAVEALTCAGAIQSEIAKRNMAAPNELRLKFRIGINIGDIIRDRDDVYGNGVNIAARLQSLAEPGGICVSEAVHDAIGSRLDLAYEFIGEKRVKNIARPVRVYRVLLERAPPGSGNWIGWLRRPATWGVPALLVVLAGTVWLTQRHEAIAPLFVGERVPYEYLAQRLPGTEKGTWKHEGEWAWFVEHYARPVGAGEVQPLAGKWGPLGSTEPVESYDGAWSLPVPIDGMAVNCAMYYPSTKWECFRYRFSVESETLLLRFDETGNCDGISYFEPGDTTADPAPVGLTELLKLSRNCQRLELR